MPVIHAPAEPTHDLGSSRFTSLATPRRGSAASSVWRIEIDPGTPALPHSVTREEVFVVLAGSAAVRFGDGAAAVAGPGDAVVVPPGVRFAIAPASDEQLRMVCCMPVGGEACTDDGAVFTPPWAL